MLKCISSGKGVFSKMYFFLENVFHSGKCISSEKCVFGKCVFTQCVSFRKMCFRKMCFHSMCFIPENVFCPNPNVFHSTKCVSSQKMCFILENVFHSGKCVFLKSFRKDKIFFFIHSIDGIQLFNLISNSLGMLHFLSVIKPRI